jgi:hypothetical protein
MAPPKSGTTKTKEGSWTQEELEVALDVKPPSDPAAIDDHVHQLLMRAQVSWLSKRDVLDILTNWQMYNLPISLMPPDQPGRAFPLSAGRLQAARLNFVWNGASSAFSSVQQRSARLVPFSQT